MDELRQCGCKDQSPGLLARVVRIIKPPRRRYRPLRGGFARFRRDQLGQAIVEYLLVLIIAFTFTHQVFFNTKFGFKSVLTKTMMRLGSFLEQNLKSGTKVGGNNGRLSLDPYAGTDRWSN